MKVNTRNQNHKPGYARLVALCCVAFFPLAAGLGSLTSCAKSEAPPISDAEVSPGGEASVGYSPIASFELPAANLPLERKAIFHAGKALANQPWIKAPTTTTARDGLGPIYNARTCLACHVRGGKGSVPNNSEQMLSRAIVRLSITADAYNEKHGSEIEPIYGEQLQTQSVALAHQLRTKLPDEIILTDVAPEAYAYIDWQFSEVTYPDGDRVNLRAPKLRIEHLAYGALHPQTQKSLRMAPAIHGMGLIEAIKQSDINALADPDDVDSDGVSGRVNQVWDFKQSKTVPGRFGHKANRASLEIAVAAAFSGDLGINNPVFPEEPCTMLQPQCSRQANGNDADGVELPQELLDLVVDFNRQLAVPRRRPLGESGKQGRTLFYQLQCQACHQPSFVTGTSPGNPHLSEQLIWPYSDFLLHDLGQGLADGRADYLASGREWRTPPLWGVGLNRKVNGVVGLLHDGRAQTIEEAILWHAGEAERSRDAFMQLSKMQREHLIKFVKAL